MGVNMYTKGDAIWYKRDETDRQYQLAAISEIEEGERRLIAVGRGYKFTKDNRYKIQNRGTDRYDDRSISVDEIVARANTDYLAKAAEKEAHYAFFGAEGNCFRLGDTVLKAIEDESDGYRSYLETVATYPGDCILYSQPVATVAVVAVRGVYVDGALSNFDGYVLVDVADEHVWLLIGTNYMDDYYPNFVFDYFPKEPKGE
jgi:hypothetical protein